MIYKAVDASALMAAGGVLVAGINDWSVPFFAVPLTAITMAAFGAMCSFAWQQGETTRGRLFVIAAASTFVGASCVSAIPFFFGVTVPKDLQPPLAFLCGLVAPWVVPAAKGAVPAFFKGLSNMFVKMMAAKVGNDNYSGGDDYSQPRTYIPPRKQDDGEV